MKTENKVLMMQAREALAGNWGTAVGASLIYIVITFIVNQIPFGGLVIGGPLSFGVAVFFLALSRKQPALVGDLFKGFNYFLTTFVASLLVFVYTLLWTLLLIVPGIIAAISYSQVFFILAENPTMKASDAIKKSKEMMMGNKRKFLYLMFRFLGWAILCAFTFGIGMLWLFPYIQVTLAKFHDDIKGNVVIVPAEVKVEEVKAEVAVTTA